jgi:DNA-binding response OmpR family regulator
MRLLVIEDYTPLRTALIKGLSEAGHLVASAADGEDGDARLRESEHEIIILDLMLPGISGRDLLLRMRARDDRRPVLLLTARDEIASRIDGLDAGADDYLVKPFDFGELLARLRALERRLSVPTSLVVEDLILDRKRRAVERAGTRIDLTATEFALLTLLAERARTVVAREEIRRALYDREPQAVTSNIVDVYIGYLRRKIDLPGMPRLIHTRRGHGYLLGPQP